MQWWDDIWLNEGFATWAEAHMVDAWKPSFGATIDQIADVQFVMDTDALATARAVRQPVHSTGEALESFDGLTYEKGAAVLRMLESWLGPDTFRRGVQRYLHDNAWKNAKADDLFHALEFVSAESVSDMAHGFLDKPGVPSVQVNWKCGGKLELRESQWRPLGEGGDPAGKWTLPVCVTSDAQKSKACFTVGADPITRDLGGKCPTWLFPNAEEAGYYRFVLDRPQLLALARGERSLDPVERLGLVSNAWAAVRQGAIEPGTLLDLLPTFDQDGDRHVVEAIIDTIRGFDRALVDDADRAAFEHFVSARLAARKAMLGWEPRKGVRDDDDRALLRGAVLRAMGRTAHDPATLAEAEKYTQAWLKDPRSVAADTASIAVPLASLRAGTSRLEELRAAAKNARTPEDRVLAIRAMGSFEDPAVLEQAWALAFTGEVRQSDFGYLFSGASTTAASAARLYAWEKRNWSALTGILNGPLGRSRLVGVAASLCTRDPHDDAQTFFTQAVAGMDGLARPLSEDLERASLCIALHDHGAADVEKYFKGRR
jgi:cytosol alanyl aminopeptidase